MSADTLLEHLAGVRGKDGHWMARCPAHEDRRPSLAIREEPDGRVLLHCFAGCAVQEVLSAVGLHWQDIMPEALTQDRLRPVRQPWARATVLHMRQELRVAILMLGDWEHDRPVSEADRKRGGQAARALSQWLAAVDE